MAGLLTPQIAEQVDILSVTAVAELVEARPNAFDSIFSSPDADTPEAQFTALNLANQGAAGGIENAFSQTHTERQREEQRKKQPGQSLSDQITLLQSQISALEAENEVLIAQRAELAGQLADLQARLQGAQLEANILDTQIASQEAHIDQMDTELDQILDESYSLQDTHYELYDELVVMQADGDIEGYDHNYVVHVDANGNYYVDDLNGDRTMITDPDDIADIEQQLAEGKGLGNDNAEQAALFRETLEGIHETWTSYAYGIDEYDRAREELEALQERREELEGEINAMQQQEAELIAEIESLDTQIAENEAQIAALTAELETLQNDLSAQRDAMETLDASAAYLTSEDFAEKIDAFDRGEITREQLYEDLDPQIIALLEEKGALEDRMDSYVENATNGSGHFSMGAFEGLLYQKLELEEQLEEEIARQENTEVAETEAETETDQETTLALDTPDPEQAWREAELSDAARDYARMANGQPISLADLESEFDLDANELAYVVDVLEANGATLTDDVYAANEPAPAPEETPEPATQTASLEQDDIPFNPNQGPSVNVGFGMG